MLMLTRRRGEAVDLIDRASGEVLVTVTVLELLPKGSIRLGFDAKDSIQILRDDARRRDDAEEENGDGNGQSNS